MRFRNILLTVIFFSLVAVSFSSNVPKEGVKNTGTLRIAASAPSDDPYRLFPYTPAPNKTVCYINASRFTFEEAIFAASLQGVVNSRFGRPVIFLDWKASGCDFWFEDAVERYNLSYYSMNLTEAAAAFKDYISGYIIIDNNKDHTINLATTMAGIYGAVICDPERTDLIEGLNLTEIADLRNYNYTDFADMYKEAFDLYYKNCSERVIASLIPGRFPAACMLRDYLIQQKAFVYYLDTTVGGKQLEVFKYIMENTPENMICMGWYPAGGAGESSSVYKMARYGKYIIASDWSPDLSWFSGLSAFYPEGRPTFRQNIEPDFDVTPEPGTTYVTLLYSDGDNLHFDTSYLFQQFYINSNPTDRDFPIGWTISPALRDLMPNVMEYYYEHSDTDDLFIAGPSGVTYTYPDALSNPEFFLKMSSVYMNDTDLNIGWPLSINLYGKALFSDDILKTMAENGYVGIFTQFGYSSSYEYIRSANGVPVFRTFFLANDANRSDINPPLKYAAEILEKFGSNGGEPRFIPFGIHCWTFKGNNLYTLAEFLRSKGCKIVRPDEFIILYLKNIISKTEVKVNVFPLNILFGKEWNLLYSEYTTEPDYTSLIRLGALAERINALSGFTGAILLQLLPILFYIGLIYITDGKLTPKRSAGIDSGKYFSVGLPITVKTAGVIYLFKQITYAQGNYRFYAAPYLPAPLTDITAPQFSTVFDDYIYIGAIFAVCFLISSSLTIGSYFSDKRGKIGKFADKIDSINGLSQQILILMGILMMPISIWGTVLFIGGILFGTAMDLHNLPRFGEDGRTMLRAYYPFTAFGAALGMLTDPDFPGFIIQMCLQAVCALYTIWLYIHNFKKIGVDNKEVKKVGGTNHPTDTENISEKTLFAHITENLRGFIGLVTITLIYTAVIFVAETTRIDGIWTFTNYSRNGNPLFYYFIGLLPWTIAISVTLHTLIGYKGNKSNIEKKKTIIRIYWITGPLCIMGITGYIIGAYTEAKMAAVISIILILFTLLTAVQYYEIPRRGLWIYFLIIAGNIITISGGLQPADFGFWAISISVFAVIWIIYPVLEIICGTKERTKTK